VTKKIRAKRAPSSSRGDKEGAFSSFSIWRIASSRIRDSTIHGAFFPTPLSEISLLLNKLILPLASASLLTTSAIFE
jgi:hypothetical protein